jgi:Tol biopolymer transport system component
VVLFGFPSRVRVSPDGRYGAVTTFVRGDSYATANTYSTRTDVIDMHTGKILFDLSQLQVSKGGRVFNAPNFNFWGVTFSTDDKTFYATLGTGNTTYLIRGNIQTRRASVVTSNVECPSLSPDGKEIAFKRRLSGPTVRWRISVLDLATGKIHPLAETRSVDDQVEWLDNSTVLYGVLQDSAVAAMNPLSATTPSLTNGATLATNTWSVPANGGGKPQLVSRDTWSEVVTNR